eukprot:9485867-Karenia_brevis.AAC.1
MARSTASASGCGVRLEFGLPSAVMSGGLWQGGCFVCSWSRTAALWARGAPLVRALQAALRPPSLV